MSRKIASALRCTSGSPAHVRCGICVIGQSIDFGRAFLRAYGSAQTLGVIDVSGGDAGIRTLDTRLRYAPLARAGTRADYNPLQPCTSHWQSGILPRQIASRSGRKLVRTERNRARTCASCCVKAVGFVRGLFSPRSSLAPDPSAGLALFKFGNGREIAGCQIM